MKDSTKFAHIGRPKAILATAVNPDITRASTLLFEKAEDLYRTDIRAYGRHGSAVHDAVELAFNELEDGAGTSLAPSGLAACTLAILANVKAGDHILITDSIYGPTRSFSEGFLSKLDIEAERFPPRIGEKIAEYIKPNTSVIVLESPGSLTFEIQDIPTICKIAGSKNIKTIVDNTWSAGISYKPLQLGADISVHAATKYMGGHSDVMFGAVVSRTKAMANKIAKSRKFLGLATSPDDAYQILRGFRTLHTRFWTQERTAFELADWLAQQNFVAEVLYPALPTHSDHDLWKRDFSGGGCLFGVILKPATEDQIHMFMNGLKYFGLGFSYGGYESVAIHCDPQLDRLFGGKFEGPLVRFGCGLENIEDLKSDISQSANQAF